MDLGGGQMTPCGQSGWTSRGIASHHSEELRGTAPMVAGQSDESAVCAGLPSPGTPGQVNKVVLRE